jgi:hypothetical protein
VSLRRDFGRSVESVRVRPLGAARAYWTFS